MGSQAPAQTLAQLQIEHDSMPLARLVSLTETWAQSPLQTTSAIASELVERNDKYISHECNVFDPSNHEVILYKILPNYVFTDNSCSLECGAQCTICFATNTHDRTMFRRVSIIIIKSSISLKSRLHGEKCSPYNKSSPNILTNASVQALGWDRFQSSGSPPLIHLRLAWSSDGLCLFSAMVHPVLKPSHQPRKI
jgi:hypothetical protein